MKVKKLVFILVVQISLFTALMLVLNSFNGCSGGRKDSCAEVGEIRLDFSNLPGGSLAMFSVDRVIGIRVYNEIKRVGDSLFCHGRVDTAPGSGNWKDAAVMLLFYRLPCKVSKITADVHGHGPQARIIATQQDGTTQSAICPGDRRNLILYATADNPFIYAILSGQDAEWINLKLE